MSDQTEAATKKLSVVAEDATTQVRDQAEAVIAAIAASEQLAKTKKQAARAQRKAAVKGQELSGIAVKRSQELSELAVRRGQELSEVASVRGKAAAKQASKEAKKRGQAAVASAPAVAASARKVAAKKSEQAIEVARERGSELLLSALDTDPGKRLAGTQAGTALRSKLTARKRRRRKIALLLAINAGGAIAFKQLRARKSGDAAVSSYDVGVMSTMPTTDIPPTGTTPTDSPVTDTTPTDTVAPGATGTAAGDPLVGLVEESVVETPKVKAETEAPATTAGDDGELKKD